MKPHRAFAALPLLLAAVIVAACGQQETVSNPAASTLPAADVNATNVPSSPIDCAAAERETAEIAAARLYVEFNATDGDLGVHGSFDDHGWSELCVYAPNGDQILGVRPHSQLGELTMASIFFESREPELSEFGFEDLVANFPEGLYEVRALSFEGEAVTGAATFSHDVPAEPEITAPALAEDEESAAEAMVAVDNLVVTWEEVTETVNGHPLTISGYEVIVTKVDHDDPHGFSRPVYDVHLPPDRYSLSVPADFLEPDAVYELELLALETSGNQTISVGFFTTG